VEFYRVKEYGFDPEFVRMYRTEHGLAIEAYRDGQWKSCPDLGNVFFGGEGKVEKLEGDPTA
jgi:hypothetical protein